jgi:S-DNA-T family DNA segregation ATPase FtsK/SpoIIIE
VQGIAVAATSISTSLKRHALAPYRPVRTVLPAQSEVIDAVGETVAFPSPPPIPSAPVPVPPPPTAAAHHAPATRPAQRKPSKWDLPDAEALLQAPSHGHADGAYLTQVARDLAERLRLFRLTATVQPAERQGAIVSRYEITPGAAQKIQPITDRLKDLDAAYKGLRFVSLSGTGKLGVEIPVPGAQRRIITLREVLDSAVWLESEAVLPIALGVTSSGDPVVFDLDKCPHLLVAGATKSGKTVGVNIMVTSLLMRHSPSDLQLIMIDPKLIEFRRYRGLPHLLRPVITEVQEAIECLQWACEEMDSRYRQFANADAEDLDEYNAAVSTANKLARIVLVIDECADLLCVAKTQRQLVEDTLMRLAQKARSAGIHLVLATQRPSVDVITGPIKANFPSRIAYKVSQREDSKTIIDAPGAQSLLGNGDSLCLLPQLSTDLIRVHGAFVSKDEVKAVCAAWTSQATGEEQRATSPRPTVAPTEPSDLPDAPRLPAQPQQHAKVVAVVAAPTESDDLFTRAVEFARTRGYVSARQLEGELGVGFNKAQKLFGRMRADGLIKPGGPNNTHQFVGTN